MTGTLAVVLAAVAAGLLVGGPLNLLTLRLGGAPHGHPGPRSGSRTDRAPDLPYAPALPGSTPLRLLVVGSAGAVAGVIIAPPGGVVIGALVPPAGLLAWYRRKSGAVRQSIENDVADACLGLAGQMRAGASPELALAAIAQEWPALFGSAAGRATVGGDPAVSLRAAAARPGAEPLAAIASAWEVSAHTGAPLSSTLTAVADSLRTENAVRHEADTQLATVRTTSRLLAALPAGTLLLFSTGGDSPVEFLLRNPYGVACLTGALLFIGAGLGWVERTSRTAMRTPWAS